MPKSETTAIQDAIVLLREALRSEHLTMYAESRIRSAILKLESVK